MKVSHGALNAEHSHQECHGSTTVNVVHIRTLTNMRSGSIRWVIVQIAIVMMV